MPLRRLVPTVAVVSFLLGGLAVALLAGPVWHIGNLAPAAAAAPAASTPANPHAARLQATCDAFLKDFADRLGVSQDRVKSSLRSAVADAIDRAVKNGDLTADQAQKARARLDGVKGCDTLPAFGKHHGAGDAHGMGPGPGGLKSITSAAASALGISPEALQSAVISGKTLHEVDGAGVSQADFDTHFRAALTHELQPQVDAGKITAEQARVRVDQAAGLAHRLWDTRLSDVMGGGIPHVPRPVNPGTGAGASPVQ